MEKPNRVATMDATKKATTTSVDEYLATVPPELRPSIERLREQLRAAAPQAIESISYGIAFYSHYGHLVFFGASKKHGTLHAIGRELQLEYAA